MLGVVAASVALSVSQVPWNGPLAAVRVGRVEGHWILNPTFQQLEFSTIDLAVSGGQDSIVMVEGGALECPRPTCSRRSRSRRAAFATSSRWRRRWSRSRPPSPSSRGSRLRPTPLCKRVRELAETAMAQAINAKDKARPRRTGFARSASRPSPSCSSSSRRSPRNRHRARGHRVPGHAPAGAGEGRAGGRPRPRYDPPDHDRDRRAPPDARLGVVPARRDPGPGVRHPRNRRRQRIDSIDVAGETTKSFMLHYNFPRPSRRAR